MRLMFNHVTALASATLLSVLAGSASAQVFKLEQGVSATPGSTAVVDLFIDGGPADTAAFNFTVSVSTADGANFVSGNLTAVAAGGFPQDMQFETSNPTREGGRELRGVLYAPSGSTSVINTSGTNVPVASISIPIAPNSAGNTVTIRLDRIGGDGSGFEGTGTGEVLTGLVGISNAAGESVVPNGGDPATSRPLGAEGRTSTITIGTGLPPATDIAFNNTAVRLGENNPDARFEYQDFSTGNLVPNLETPFRIRVNANDSFSNLRTRNVNSQRFASALGGNSVFFVKWTYGTNTPTAYLFPQVRLRGASEGSFISFLNLYQEQASNFSNPQPVAPILVPTNGSDVTNLASYYTPPFLAANGRSAWSFQFDTLSFPAGHGQSLAGTDVLVKQIEVQEVPISALGEGTVVFSRDFETQGVPAAFTSSNVFNRTGTDVTFSTQGGMAISPQFASGESTAVPFSFGTWEGVLEGVEIQPNRVYQIIARVATVGSDPLAVPNSRLRIRAEVPSSRNDFVHEMLFSEDPARAVRYFSDNNITGTEPYHPTADGRTFVSVVTFPDAVAASNPGLKVFFDAYRVARPGTTGVRLESLEVRSHPLPEGL